MKKTRELQFKEKAASCRSKSILFYHNADFIVNSSAGRMPFEKSCKKYYFFEKKTLTNRKISVIIKHVAKSDTQYSSLAQLAEHAAVNRRVVGSSPTGGAKKLLYRKR